MLNTRNVVAAAVIVTLVSLVGACVALVQPPGGGGLGVDSYGTRGHGFLGLFEILAELKIPVERANVPPNRLLNREIVLALFEPGPEIVSTEPAYLNDVGKWVRAGGTVVVSPSPRQRQTLGVNVPSKNVLFELGLQGYAVHLVGPVPLWRSNSKRDRPSLRAATRRTARNFMEVLRHPSAPPAAVVHATAEGTLAPLFPHGLDLMLPVEGRCVLDSDWDADSAPLDKATGKHKEAGRPRKANRADRWATQTPAGAEAAAQPADEEHVPKGRIRAVLEPGGEPETLAAVFAVGQGTIAVLADSRLAQNRLVGQGDNPVLVTHLLADPQKPIIFDEFYHGLTVRANPLWLLSRFPYDILAASVLAATVLVGWRAARFLGPPLSPRLASRRTLAEYIEAMARLLNRSQQSVPFLLSEIRQGLLWRIRHDLNLPPGQDDAERVMRALARRDPALAEKARDAIGAIDDSLAQPNPSAKALEKTLAKVSLCVPRHAV